MDSKPSLFFDIALIFVCGAIVIFSFVLAQLEAPSWQAVISIAIVLITIIAVILSLLHVQKHEE